jgi:nicotinic acid phosphoribosyltransferase
MERRGPRRYAPLLFVWLLTHLSFMALVRAYEKGKRLLEEGCIFSEFGTRRRRSFKTQDDVLAGLIRANQEPSAHSSGGKLLGTSNVRSHMVRCGILNSFQRSTWPSSMA